MRQNLIICAMLLGLCGAAWAKVPAAGNLGAGIIIGDPFGPTIRYWTTPRRGFDAGIGFEDEVILYADYLWQGWNVTPQPSRGAAGGYLGLGPRYEEVDHDDDEFGIRTVGGLNYFLDTYPIELFGEIAPVFQLTPDTDVDIDAGVGLRVYFQ